MERSANHDGAAIVLSPMTGFFLALLLVLCISWVFVRSTPRRCGQHLPAACSSFPPALYSLGHGGNDAQKTMGIIAVLLFSQGQLGSGILCSFLGRDHVPSLQWALVHYSADGASYTRWGPGLPGSPRHKGSAPRPAGQSPFSRATLLGRSGFDNPYDHRLQSLGSGRRARCPQYAGTLRATL